MNSPNLLLPLRIPELGPSFGKLVIGTGRDESRVSLTGLRIQLVTKVIRHTGEARRLAANGEREAAFAALGRQMWLTVWEETVAAVAERVVGQITDHLDREARAVRMPVRLRRKVLPDPSEQRALVARLGAAGAGLIQALDRMEWLSVRAKGATALERENMESWHDALRNSARRLESAWLELEEAVDREVREWLAVADRIAAWRLPLWPVALIGTPAVGLAIWVGLMLGGWIAIPSAVGRILGLVGLP